MGISKFLNSTERAVIRFDAIKGSANDNIFDSVSRTLFGNNGDEIQVDAVIDAAHDRESSKTKFPVEKGSDISNNITIHDKKFTMTGVISNAPIQNIIDGLLNTGANIIGDWLGKQSEFYGDPVGSILKNGSAMIGNLLDTSKPHQQAFKRLDNAWGNKELISITTPRCNYENMVILNFKTADNTDYGDALFFQLSLEELRFVSAKDNLILGDFLGAAVEGLIKSVEIPALQELKDSLIPNFDLGIGKKKSPTDSEGNIFTKSINFLLK